MTNATVYIRINQHRLFMLRFSRWKFENIIIVLARPPPKRCKGIPKFNAIYTRINNPENNVGAFEQQHSKSPEREKCPDDRRKQAINWTNFIWNTTNRNAENSLIFNVQNKFINEVLGGVFEKLILLQNNKLGK